MERVRERLRRSTTARAAAGIPYAIIGDNAVAAWVSTVDQGAARNTVDADLLVNRSDFDAVKAALKSVGFHHYDLMGVPKFIDGPDGSPKDAVHLLFANKKVKETYHASAPKLVADDSVESYKLLQLESLVRMKLTSFRRKDQVHLLDMIGVGLVDETSPESFQLEFSTRLRELLDDPDG